ncbi:665_t:CDS:1, partial [Ambispora gerdemannii]
YIIGKEGIQPDLAKIEKVKEFPMPINLTLLCSFIDLISYYRRFIKDFVKISAPLHKLFKKNQSYNWMKKQQKAFDILKQHLISLFIIAYPDFSQSFTLFTDVSELGLGVVLAQYDNEGKEYVI